MRASAARSWWRRVTGGSGRLPVLGRRSMAWLVVCLLAVAAIGDGRAEEVVSPLRPAFVDRDLERLRPPPQIRTREQLIDRIVRFANGRALLESVLEDGDDPRRLARNDLRGGPVRQTPIRTAPAVDRALRGDTDWQTGVRFTPKNNSRGMVVSNIVLPIGQTLGDLDRRDELPISGDTGFSVRQLIQPRPPEGTYLVVVDLEEMDPQVDAGSKSSAFSFTLVLEAAGVGADGGRTTWPLEQLVPANGRVAGLAAIVTVESGRGDLGLEINTLAEGSDDAYWTAWFRGITLVRL